MKKEIVYVDMDGVLVNFPDHVVEIINGKEVKLPSPDGYLNQEVVEDCTSWVLKDTLNNDWTDYPGLFSYLEPLEDNLEEVLNRLEKKFKLYILSTAPWKNYSSSSDKREWIQNHFPNLTNMEGKGWLEKRLILSHRKDLNRGRYLIDDRPNNGAAKEEDPWAPESKGIVKGFGDYENQEWIHFGCSESKYGGTPKLNWQEVLEYLNC